MNSLLSPTEVNQLLAHASIPDEVTLGMPHLSLNGLSETWLLKECGHRHWSMLAAAAGLPVPEFREPAGDPIYAAFLSVWVRGASFETAREHDRLVFTSRLARTSRARFMSVNQVAVGGQQIGEIAMTSTFVRRAQRGRNRGIVRAEVPALRHVPIDPMAAPTSVLSAGDPDMRMEFERREASVIDRFIVDPCPGLDFNGADFLYFASYPAFVDRAEWAYFRPHARFAVTRRRDIRYCGNIDPGERVIVTLRAFSRECGHLAHWYHLAREQDHSTIAEIATLRVLCRPS